MRVKATISKDLADAFGLTSNVPDLLIIEPRPREVQPEDLGRIGWINITDISEENVYFRLRDGTRCFSKVEGFTAEGMRELRGLGYWRA